MILLGTRIKEICADRGISLAQLERNAGIPAKSISKWDKNTPSFDKVEKVLDALEISYDEFTNYSLIKWNQQTADERRLLEVFSQLNYDGKKLAIGILEDIAQIDSLLEPGVIDNLNHSVEDKSTYNPNEN